MACDELDAAARPRRRGSARGQNRVYKDRGGAGQQRPRFGGRHQAEPRHLLAGRGQTLEQLGVLLLQRLQLAAHLR